MIARLVLALAVVASGAAPASAQAAPHAHPPSPHAGKPCRLGPAELAANRQLDFAEFDQQQTLASSARALAARGCYAEAVRASLDWLITGPDIDDYQRNVVRFHTGQYLAQSGDERGAAAMIAGTRRGIDPRRPTFDWDGYVSGVYAFLVKDRALLDAMIARLAAKPGEGNAINRALLLRMRRCFSEPFQISNSHDPRCDAPTERG